MDILSLDAFFHELVVIIGDQESVETQNMFKLVSKYYQGAKIIPHSQAIQREIREAIFVETTKETCPYVCIHGFFVGDFSALNRFLKNNNH